MVKKTHYVKGLYKLIYGKNITGEPDPELPKVSTAKKNTIGRLILGGNKHSDEDGTYKLRGSSR